MAILNEIILDMNTCLCQAVTILSEYTVLSRKYSINSPFAFNGQAKSRSVVPSSHVMPPSTSEGFNLLPSDVMHGLGLVYVGMHYVIVFKSVVLVIGVSPR